MSVAGLILRANETTTPVEMLFLHLFDIEEGAFRPNLISMPRPALLEAADREYQWFGSVVIVVCPAMGEPHAEASVNALTRAEALRKQAPVKGRCRYAGPAGNRSLVGVGSGRQVT